MYIWYGYGIYYIHIHVVYCVQWFCFDMILCVLMYYSCVLLSLFGVLEFKRNDLQFREVLSGFLMDIPTISYSFIYSFVYLCDFFSVCVYIYMNVYTYQVLYASAIINKLFFLCWSSSESEVRYHPAPCFSWLLVAFPSFVLSVQPLFWMFYRKILLHLFLFVMKYIWVHGQSTGPNKVGIFHGLP